MSNNAANGIKVSATNENFDPNWQQLGNYFWFLATIREIPPFSAKNETNLAANTLSKYPQYALRQYNEVNKTNQYNEYM